MPELNDLLNDVENQSKHVDESIDSNNFLDSSRTIIYAAAKLGNSGELSDFRKIGLLQSFGWSEQKDLQMIYELGSKEPYMVPGKTRGAISLSRLLLAGNDLLNAMYYATGEEIPEDKFIKSLADIDVPLYLMFVTTGHKTSGDASKVIYSRIFSECHITARNETVQSGQNLIAENVNISYASISDAKIKTA